METRRIRDYIQLGTNFRYLQDVQEGTHVHGDSFVVGNIEGLFNYLEEFGLPVTIRAGALLRKFNRLIGDLPADADLSNEDAAELRRLVEELRTTLMAEAAGKIAYVVSEQRLDVEKLMNDLPALLTAGTFGALPDIAKHDLEEAGKCLAFERPTSAAFHLLRGTESTLRFFYCSIIKRNRTRPLLWKPMVDGLRARRRNRPPDALLDTLDSIRRNFRNPTQHPELIYDMDDAQNLFGLCVDVIDRMVKFLRASPK